MIRSILLKLHLWAGLGAGVFLVLVSGSGAVLAFRDEIDRALNPALLHCEPHGERVAPEEALAAARRDRDGERPAFVRLPRRADDPYAIFTSGGQVAYVDAYGGRVLGWRPRNAGFVEGVSRLHTELCAGKKGNLLVGASAAVLFFLSLSGIVLWWPKRLRDGLVLRLRGSGRRLNFDLHRVIGFYASGVLAAVSGSGVLLATGGVVFPLLDRMAHTPAPPVLPKTADPAATPIPASAALAAADEALPGSAASTLVLPAGKNAFYTVLRRFPEDRTPGGRSKVIVDAGSGAVIAVESSRTAPPVQRLRNLVRMLHSGDVYGLPTRVLAALASAWVSGLFLTGALIWWSRRKPAKNAAPI